MDESCQKMLRQCPAMLVRAVRTMATSSGATQLALEASLTKSLSPLFCKVINEVRGYTTKRDGAHRRKGRTTTSPLSSSRAREHSANERVAAQDHERF